MVDEPQNTIVLFGTSACHLCELAEGLLHEAQSAFPELRVQKVDISESDALFERYALVIPVVRNSRGKELSWPFTDRDLDLFLRQPAASQ